MIFNFDAFFHILIIIIFILFFRFFIKRNLKSVIELRDDEFFYKNSFIEAKGDYSKIKNTSLGKSFFGIDLRIEGVIEVRQKFFGMSVRQVIQIPDLSEEVAKKYLSDINRKIMEIERLQSGGGESRS